MEEQDKPVTETSPELTKVIFENEKVTIIELRVEKGSRADKHHHPQYFVYSITPFEYLSTSDSGRVEHRKMEAGEIDWKDGESHTVDFLAPGRALVVELK